MPRSLAVHCLPLLVDAEALAESSVVVIDVLRATTTICHALMAGAKRVVPCLEVADALALAARLAKNDVVLGGERGGLRIEGFELGNSPAEYTPQSVGGKTVVFTTTNGTAALQHARQAKGVYVAAFVNASAVVRALTSERDVNLLCAGTRGEITREDVLLAGLLVERLLGAATWRVRAVHDALPLDVDDVLLNDEALLALAAWRDSSANWRGLPAALLESKGGRNLERLGLASDIDDAAQRDRFDIVPVFDAAAGCITPRSASCEE